MVDLFPTLLEAMGFTIKGHRAGLGASLLAEPNQQTLVERHGLVPLNARMREENALQQRLWEGLVPNQSQEREEQESPPADAQVVESPHDATGEAPASVQ